MRQFLQFFVHLYRCFKPLPEPETAPDSEVHPADYAPMADPVFVAAAIAEAQVKHQKVIDFNLDRLAKQRVVAQRLIDEVLTRIPGIVTEIVQDPENAGNPQGTRTFLRIRNLVGSANPKMFRVYAGDHEEARNATREFADWVAMKRIECKV